MNAASDVTAGAEAEAEIRELLQDYFDGLHFSDAARLGCVFHTSAMYACATSGTLQRLDMAAYLPMVAQRPSPASLGQARADEIVSIEMAGPVTALARVHCTSAPKRFTDLLTLVRVDGDWRILAKVFHFDVIGS